MKIVDEVTATSTGRMSEVLALFFPILVVSFSSCFLPFIEQLFFARISAEAMEAALNVSYVCRIFESSCIALVMMGQVCVGRWQGAGNFRAIGSGVWQFVWFSFLSMIITLPLNIFSGVFYFHQTAIGGIALPYLYLIASISFLYPLGAALSCFYLGRGKARFVVTATLCSQIVNLILDYFLIFGWEGWIPPLGLMGRGISAMIAQGGLCLLLFVIFLSSKNNKTYGTHHWHFQPKLFWECIHPGFLRALGRLSVLIAWVLTARLMTIRGGDYALVLSIGGTVFLFTAFFSDAICQAMTTVISHILGANTYHFLGKACRSGSIIVFATGALLSIPLLIFPSVTFHILFPSINLDPFMIRKILLGVWMSIVFFTYSYVPASFVLAFKDTKFILFIGGMTWIYSYLLMYIVIEVYDVAADLFWIVLSFTHIITLALYFWRMKSLNARVIPFKTELSAIESSQSFD